MTDLQKELVYRMATGEYYLVPRMNHNGRSGYMLYEGRQDPVMWYSDKSVKIVRDILKKDKRQRYTLNLSLVRKQHGKSLVKILYNRKWKSDAKIH